MDPIVHREFERLVNEGQRNHAPWDYVEKRLRSMAAELRRLNNGMAPNQQDLEGFIDRAQSTYEA